MTAQDRIDAMRGGIGTRAIGRADVARLCHLMSEVATDADRRAVAAALRIDDAALRTELARICRDGEVSKPFYRDMCLPGMPSPLTFATSLLNVMRAREGRPRITAGDLRKGMDALIAGMG